MSPDEIFDYPPEMDGLKGMQFFSKVNPEAYTVRGTVLGKPKPQQPPTPDPRNALPKEAALTGDSIAGIEDELVKPQVADSLERIDDSLRLTTDSLAVSPSGVGIPETIDEPDAADTPADAPDSPVEESGADLRDELCLLPDRISLNGGKEVAA